MFKKIKISTLKDNSFSCNEYFKIRNVFSKREIEKFTLKEKNAVTNIIRADL